MSTSRSTNALTRGESWWLLGYQRVADATALGRAGLPNDIGPMIAALPSEDNRRVNARGIEVRTER